MVLGAGLALLLVDTVAQSSSYSCRFWRPWDDSNYTHFPNLQQGHWTTNPQNWNSLAGFVKYLPWDR
jgi:hypothetical protein